MAALRKGAKWGVLAIVVFLVASWAKDTPGLCVGAPSAYRQLRRAPIGEQTDFMRRLPLSTRVDVYVAEQRCGRPATLYAGDIALASADQAARELLSGLLMMRDPARQAVLVEALAGVDCTAIQDSVLRAEMTLRARALRESWRDGSAAQTLVRSSARKIEIECGGTKQK